MVVYNPGRKLHGSHCYIGYIALHSLVTFSWCWSNNADGSSQISGIPEFYADDFSKIAKDELAQNHDFRIEPLIAYAGVLGEIDALGSPLYAI